MSSEQEESTNAAPAEEIATQDAAAESTETKSEVSKISSKETISTKVGSVASTKSLPQDLSTEDPNNDVSVPKTSSKDTLLESSDKTASATSLEDDAASLENIDSKTSIKTDLKKVKSKDELKASGSASSLSATKLKGYKRKTDNESTRDSDSKLGSILKASSIRDSLTDDNEENDKKTKSSSKVSIKEKYLQKKTSKFSKDKKKQIKPEAVEENLPERETEIYIVDLKQMEEEEKEPSVNIESFFIGPKMMDFDEFRASDDEQSVESDIVEAEQVSEMPFSNFLDDFLDVPDVTEISSSESDEKISYVKHYSLNDRGDRGTFVHPLTGQIISSSDSTKEDDAPIEEEEVEEEEEDYIDIPLSDPVLHEAAPIIQDDETFQKIFYIEPPKEEEEEDVEALAYAREIEVVTEGILEYLYLVIGKVVSFASYVDPTIVLQKILDKRKLMELVIQKSIQLDAEEMLCENLNRMICDYYRRKKNNRPFVQEMNEEILLRNLAKLNTATWEMDRLIKIQTIKADRIKQNMGIISVEESALQQLVNIEVASLENFIKDTIGAGKSEKLQKEILNQLDKMQAMREKVSKARANLLKKNHSLEVLRNKLRKLESLSEDLSMTNFISLQTQVTSISKKIEERNTDLMRTRTRFNCDLHIISHSREQELMIVKKLDKESNKFRSLYANQQFYKERIHEHKMRRQDLRKIIMDTSFNGGLLCRPDLLYDYDDLYEQIVNAKYRVQTLSKKLEKSANKRDKIEKLIISLEESFKA